MGTAGPAPAPKGVWGRGGEGVRGEGEGEVATSWGWTNRGQATVDPGLSAVSYRTTAWSVPLG